MILALDHSPRERARYRAAVIARAVDAMPRLAVDDFGNYITHGSWGVAPGGHTLGSRNAGTFGAVSAIDAMLIGAHACIRQIL